jgi:hypothetical protein
MSNLLDWRRKLLEAANLIKTGYEQIGRKTGASHLAVIYPPEAETAVFKEWQNVMAGLGTEFDISAIDVLDVTMSFVEELGCQQIVDTINTLCC